MSSKILRGETLTAIEPYRWQLVSRPNVGRPPAADRPQRQETSGHERPAGPDPKLEQRIQAEKEAAFRQGEAAGRAAASQELEAQLLRMARTIAELSSHKSRLRQEAERDVVELAMAIARRILRRQILIDPEALAGLVKAAFERVSLREVSEVRVAPAHTGALERFLSQIGAPEAISLLPDATLEPGAVLLQIKSGLVDASAETQLEEIGRGLADALGGPR